MHFPAGWKVNPIGRCRMWPTTKAWDLRRHCSSSKLGEGWALVSGLGVSALPRLSVNSGGLSSPTDTGNFADAPPDCSATDTTQYSRTYGPGLSFASPLGGLVCTPNGEAWVHEVVYAGIGNGAVNPATGAVYDRSDRIKRRRAAKVTSRTGLIFASESGIAAVSFAGSIITAKDRTISLHADLPAFNSAGLKGYLPFDTDLVDLHMVINNSRFITAGPCASDGKVLVRTAVTYNPFPSDFGAGNLTRYPDNTQISKSPCSR